MNTEDGEDGLSPLEALADALLEAHHHARDDGDPRLIKIVEDALMYVGRRLANVIVNTAAISD